MRSAILTEYMRIVRRRLPWMVGAWLLCQAAAAASAPLALCCRPASDLAVADEECCPGVAPGQVCPMHHTKEGGRKCVMRSACASNDAALLSLSGIVGLTSRESFSISDRTLWASIAPMQPNTLARASRPESPPPRA